MGYGLVAPLALCLDTEVSARFGERDLDLPSADVQRDDVGGFEGDIGTEEGLRLALCVGVANQDPPDRQHCGARPVPQGDPGCDLERLPAGMAIPGGDDDPCPACRRVAQQGLEFWQRGPFCAGRPIVANGRWR